MGVIVISAETKLEMKRRQHKRDRNIFMGDLEWIDIVHERCRFKRYQDPFVGSYFRCR